MHSAESFVEAFRRQERVEGLQHLYGRVTIRDVAAGPIEEDLDSLLAERHTRRREVVAHHPDFAFVFGPDTLSKLPGVRAAEVLRLLGLTEGSIRRSLDVAHAGQRRFYLNVFQLEDPSLMQPAHIHGVHALLQHAHPTVAERLAQHVPAFWALAGPDLAQQRKAMVPPQWSNDRNVIWNGMTSANGPDDDQDAAARFMSHEHYLASPNSAADARRYLHDMLFCNELYGFDGYMYDASGSCTGLKEYLVVNQSLAQLGARFVEVPL